MYFKLNERELRAPLALGAPGIRQCAQLETSGKVRGVSLREIRGRAEGGDGQEEVERRRQSVSHSVLRRSEAGAVPA